MQKNWWVWFTLSAAATTGLFVAVAVLAGEDEGATRTRTRQTTSPSPLTLTALTTTTTTTTTNRAAVGTTRERRVKLARVPDLRGMTRAQAVGELQEAGFRAKFRRERSFVPDGIVFEQTPEPGKRLQQGRTVLVTVSLFKPRAPPPPPPAPPVSALPRVVGLDYSEAAARMELLGIVANAYPVRSNRPVTIVVGQTPAPATRARRGSRVRLIVSVGKRRLPPARVPDTVGLKELTAHSRCRDEHFTCRTFLVPARGPGEAGRVVRQRPQAGRIEQTLTQVTLYVGR
jgi:beta-lactam-binding protein with PASTA domain